MPSSFVVAHRTAERGYALPSSHDRSPTSGATTDRWVAIVDDHESMRSSLARAFRLECIRSVTFPSAEAYLAYSSPTAPFCLVLDMQLPGMKGVELAHLLERERPPRPPTIFISAHEDLLASLDGDGMAHGRLSKPFDLEELMALVKPLL
jgi:FixJ family two-component response regulator